MSLPSLLHMAPSVQHGLPLLEHLLLFVLFVGLPHGLLLFLTNLHYFFARCRSPPAGEEGTPPIPDSVVLLDQIVYSSDLGICLVQLSNGHGSSSFLLLDV